MDGRLEFLEGPEHCGRLDELDMLVKMVREAVASCPDDRLATLCVLPNVVFLDVRRSNYSYALG